MLEKMSDFFEKRLDGYDEHMMTNIESADKFYPFTARKLPTKKSVIAKQMVRSGTSVGANINEANYGQSKAAFISKLHISLKETAETEYWSRLLVKSELLTVEEGSPYLKIVLK